ncbi:MAG TPA: hypothetical protein VMI53_12695 [Opitutaceae bacterium]|nr:hypothetical protein [Opitutaceae bacterium]
MRKFSPAAKRLCFQRNQCFYDRDERTFNRRASVLFVTANQNALLNPADTYAQPALHEGRLRALEPETNSTDFPKLQIQ